MLGCALGGISGYYGGVPDLVIQRVIEFLISIPTIPLWMALSAALPPRWTPIQVYFGITIILSVIGWSGLARVVRGRLLELREEDFVTAARISAASEPAIIVGHLWERARWRSCSAPTSWAATCSRATCTRLVSR